MLGALKKLFGLGPSVNYADMMKSGGIIIDVRTKSEFASGNIKGSVNIPLDQLSSGMSKLKDKNQAIITCCASGMRSASGKSILKNAGYTNVHNGGSWLSLRNKI